MKDEPGFRKLLTDLAHIRADRVPQIERLITQLEVERKRLDQELAEARQDKQRAADYKPFLDGKYICPACWKRGRTSSLQVIGMAGRPSDTYKCNVCGEDYYSGSD